MGEHIKLEYRSPKTGDPAESARQSARVTALVGLLINLAGTGYICIMWAAGLWWVPPGTSIRPMGPVLYTFMNAVLNAVIGCSCGATAVWIGRGDRVAERLGILTLFLALHAPLALPIGICWFIMSRHGLSFSP